MGYAIDSAYTHGIEKSYANSMENTDFYFAILFIVGPIWRTYIV